MIVVDVEALEVLSVSIGVLLALGGRVLSTVSDGALRCAPKYFFGMDGAAVSPMGLTEHVVSSVETQACSFATPQVSSRAWIFWFTPRV